MSQGKVKFFNGAKGFGFITEEGTNIEYFVHVTEVKGKIKENDEVTFDVADGKKGKNAVNVHLV